MILEMIINYVFFIIMALAIFLFWRLKPPKTDKVDKIEHFVNKHATKIALCILLVFTLAKLYKIAELPHEHLDEQFLMYQVKSFLRIGTDMYGTKFPVYSRAWGCGMSMGYIYLACIFCKFFGVNYFTVRLPMALIGTISGWFIYLIGKNKNKMYGIMATLVYCAIPYNYLAQRWALDRTLFPLVFIIAVYFAIEYFKKQKPSALYISFTLFGLSLYGYANAYIIVPAFLLFCLIYSIRHKKIRLKDIIGPAVLLVIIALPLLAHVLKNVLGIIDIDKFLFFTIADAKTDRGSEFGLHFDQIPTMIAILFGQTKDPNITMIVPGLYYLFMIPFVAFGIYSYFKKAKQRNLDIVDSIVLFLFSFIMLYGIIILDSDAGKLNVLMFIFPILITEGINYCFMTNYRFWLIPAMFTVICFFIAIGGYFISDGYVEHYEKELSPVGIEKLISNIQNDDALEEKNVYLVCFGHYGTPALLNSINMTDEEMKNLEYVTYNHKYYGRMEGFPKIKNFELLKPWHDSPSYFARLDETNFELDVNGVYIMPTFKEGSGDIEAVFKALEKKLLQVVEYRYTSEYGNYNIYY